MEHFKRIINAIGQGGFSVETIGDFTVVYDCGARKAQAIIDSIDSMIEKRIDHVDVLVLSHFDSDHVNGLKYLLDRVHVHKAYVPNVPSDFKLIYNVFTGGAYLSMMRSLELKQSSIVEIDEFESEYFHDRTSDVWEWRVGSMMDINSWYRVKVELENLHVDPSVFCNVEKIFGNLFEINHAFKNAGFSQGSNDKGLIMLSQHVASRQVLTTVTYGTRIVHKKGAVLLSSCLFMGDAKVKTQEDIDYVKKVLDLKDSVKLLLTQIPHHGSKRNSSALFAKCFDSCWYFCQDSSDKRIKTNSLFSFLTRQISLLLLDKKTSGQLTCEIDVE